MAHISIQRALSELKMLDKRIQRKIHEATFGGYSIGKKFMKGFNSKEEIEQQAKSDYDSIQDLIVRRNKIKSAIVLSNAMTQVEIAGVKMSVAEAIERKSSIEYDKNLLSRLKLHYIQLTDHVEQVNEEVKQRLDKHLENLFGKEGKTNAANNELIVKQFHEENEAKLIDPINLKVKIEKLTQQIEEFEANVDHVLTESNVLQKIDID